MQIAHLILFCRLGIDVDIVVVVAGILLFQPIPWWSSFFLAWNTIAIFPFPVIVLHCDANVSHNEQYSMAFLMQCAIDELFSNFYSLFHISHIFMLVLFLLLYLLFFLHFIRSSSHLLMQRKNASNGSHKSNEIKFACTLAKAYPVPIRRKKKQISLCIVQIQ